MKDKQIYNWIVGLWIMIVIPVALWLIFNWKIALGFFVVSQLILMFIKLIHFEK